MEEKVSQSFNKMSAIPTALLSGLQNGEFSGCFMMNGQWHGIRAFPNDETPIVVEQQQDHYTKMHVWELANLSKRRGLGYSQPNKKAYIDKLREQDASGSVPAVQVTDYDDPITPFHRLNWYELYEICHKLKIPLRDGGKRWRKNDLVEVLRKAAQTEPVL